MTVNWVLSLRQGNKKFMTHNHDRFKAIVSSSHPFFHSKQISMPPAGIEPVIPESERPQTRALDGADTGIGTLALL